MAGGTFFKERMVLHLRRRGVFAFEPSGRAGATALPLRRTAMPSNTADKPLKAVFIHHAEQTPNLVQFINLLTLLSSATIPWTRGSR